MIFETATQVSQSQSWFTARSGGPRLASAGIHAALVALALIPWTSGLQMRTKLKETTVMLYTPAELIMKPLSLPARSSGGGGGGKRQPTPASRGALPPAADKQLAPPSAEPPKNPDPSLIVLPTIVAPQLALRVPELLNFGDPNGIVGPQSSGPGTGGGIGNGDGRGDGKRNGPGAIDGNGGGCCDGTFHIGGGVTGPVIQYRVDPEYSEEARKARFEGTVILETVFRRDGTIDVVHVGRSLGFGLDQNAIQALKKWRFLPGKKNGVPVDTVVNVEVRFNIR